MTSLSSDPLNVERRSLPGLTPRPAVLVWSAAGGLAVGALTQLGQSFLPDPLLPLANSAGPWVLAAFALAWLSPTSGWAAFSGVVTLAGSELGYAAMASLRGFPSASTTVAFWLTAAAVFGPVVGLAAYYVRIRQAPAAALGGGLVAGIIGGEGLASWLTVRDTTPPGYWIAEMAVGVVMLAMVARRTTFNGAALGFAIGVAALLATRFLAVFGA